MIKKLLIKNVALIDNAEISFTNGLNVLSGETGAGKSVILESLNFVLGAKADKSFIRNGENECLVKAEFDISDCNSIKGVFEELGIEYDDLFIVQRKFTIDGKGEIRLNGENINSTMLRKFTSLLVDIHGQSEHFHLLKSSNQLKLIDNFGAKEIDFVKSDLSKLYSDYKNVLSKLEECGGDENSRLIRLDILNFQIKEIQELDLKEGEEESLLTIKEKLLHQEKILIALGQLNDSLNGEGGINDILANAVKIMSGISEFSSEYSSIYERLNSLYIETEDISNTSSSILENFDTSEYSLEEIENRLEKIKSIKKKYGEDYNAIQNFLNNAKEEKSNLENFVEISESLTAEKKELEQKLYKGYIALNNLRKKYSEEFSNKVIVELSGLGMTKAQFTVKFNDFPSIEDCKFNSPNGVDDLEFYFSANLGEPVKPLSFVISGGEMSRFMLAIKSQSAKYNDISTFVFDEIDAGISGIIAKTVAEKFAVISKDVQVIAITHLPQISAMADNNLLIVKSEAGDKTITTVKPLSYEEKIMEITRLVGGNSESVSATSHAKELILNANNFKKSLN